MPATLPACLLLPRYWPTWLMLGSLWCVTRLPYAWQLATGRLIGRLAFRLGRRRRRIAATNLELCFPELTDTQRQHLLSEHFVSLGIALIEFALSWWGSDAKLEPLAQIAPRAMHPVERCTAARLLAGRAAAGEVRWWGPWPGGAAERRVAC